MNILSSSILTVIFTLFLIVIRGIKGESAMPLSLCITVGLAGAAMSAVHPVIEYVNELSSGSTDAYMIILFKALGISFITSTCSDICRDCGENAIASKLEFFGKCEIIAISLPLVKELVGLVTEVMNF